MDIYVPTATVLKPSDSSYRVFNTRLGSKGINIKKRNWNIFLHRSYGWAEDEQLNLNFGTDDEVLHFPKMSICSSEAKMCLSWE
jgi:hypothetical protein